MSTVSAPGTPPVGGSCEFSLRVAGMSCAACQAHVQRALTRVPGVQDATVDLLAHTARVTGSPELQPEQLAAAVRKAGYDVLDPHTAASPEAAPSSQDNNEPIEPGQHSLGLRACLALLAGAFAMVASMPLMMSATANASSAPPDRLAGILTRLSMPLIPHSLLNVPPGALRWTLLPLSLATMLFAAPEIYRAAWRAARHRATNMNTLVALGTLVAFAASGYTTVSLSIGKSSANFSDVYFEAVILILGFLLAGRWLEAGARRRATASLRAFAHQETGPVRWVGEGFPPELETAPESLLNGPETLLPLDALAVGDLLRVLPGDRVPLDGVVLAGRSSVDESMLTGESLPVARSTGDKLFSGTLNLEGPLLLRATALGADSMQAQMARLLERARSSRAPMQRLADRVSAVFVPAVLGIAALTFGVWALADNTGTHHLGYGRALSLAVAVLVVACPCAMGLAVPAAVAVSLGTAARAGLLIKGGEALERLASVDTVAFDKTGTLTEGRPVIAAVQLSDGRSFADHAGALDAGIKELLTSAVAVEGASIHPLAAAVRAYAAGVDGLLQPTVAESRILPGVGAEANVNGRHVTLGNADLLPAGVAPPLPPDDLGHATPMYLVVDGSHRATFYAVDAARASARPALATLRNLGLRTELLTGDISEAAQAIASELGLEDVKARLLPADKLSAISSLQREHHRVAMVGDGLNDAAALAHADAGIAMASGTDLARDAGHVLLLHHDLRLVPLSILLARRTRRLMRQNLAWALLYNVLGIPIAAGVLLPAFGIALSPALASAAMALSSVSVLLNSLRLAKLPRSITPV